MIEHIVISSGGPNILVQLGMLGQAVKSNVLDIANIKSVHGCSSGTILGVFICLKIPVEDVIEYVITRRWDKCVRYDIHQFYTNKGIIDNQLIEDMLIPFFKAYDVPLDITLKDFYLRTGVDFTLLTTEVSEMKSVTLHHSTFPDLPVLTAVTMSSVVPIVFAPVKYKDSYYIDGVCRRHCPIVDYPEETVCVITIDTTVDTTVNFEDITEYFQYILIKSYRILSESEDICKGVQFKFKGLVSTFNAEVWKKTIEEEDYRREMIEQGRNSVLEQLEKVEL